MKKILLPFIAGVVTSVVLSAILMMHISLDIHKAELYVALGLYENALEPKFLTEDTPENKLLVVGYTLDSFKGIADDPFVICSKELEQLLDLAAKHEIDESRFPTCYRNSQIANQL